ncbi:MAG TPA: hypothetical protein VIA18_03540 [Polyangia bacterium]|nr:hypothetical protein [Polyangia bacterium]
MRALDELVTEAPGTAASADAAEWLGDLWRTEHDDSRAETSYRHAYEADNRQARVLAARGLGDIAIDRRHFSTALAFYLDARAASASPLLDAELDLKIALARRLRMRALCEWGCWAFVAATIAGLLAHSRFWRGPRLSVPTELLYIVPIYALLTVACIGRDSKVLHALWLIAASSSALIGSASAAAERNPPSGHRRLLRMALVTAATVALLYASANRAGLVDSMLFTVAV